MNFQASIKQLVKPLVPQLLIEKRRQRKYAALAKSAGLELIFRDIVIDLEKNDKVLRIRAAHWFYLEHMIENFDYYVGSVFPIRNDGKCLVDMSAPRYHRLTGFADMPFLFPSHTEPYGTTAAYLDFANLGEGKVVLDIGAYSGVTSIIFAQLVGKTGHVFALEADETNYECAVQNLQLAKRWMGVDNITLVRKAMWSHGNGISFSNEGAMGSSAVSITGGRRGIETTVPSTTMEQFCSEAGLTKIDFIKIDIEGGEVEVLKQSIDFLSRLRTKLVVEPHMVDGEMSTKRCCSSLEAAGYSVRVRDKIGESEPLVEAEHKQ